MKKGPFLPLETAHDLTDVSLSTYYAIQPQSPC